MSAGVSGTVDGKPEPVPEWLRKAPRHCADPLAAARGLRELIDAHSDEAERQGFLPEAVVRALAAAGLYGMLVPREFGGAEPHPVELLEAIAELSSADGSTGWCVMANVFFTGGIYAMGGDALVHAAFRTDAGYIGAGQISSLGRADRVPGGYRVSGSFHFGSGSREASWFLGAVVEYVDGKPNLGPEGLPVIKFAFTPRENVRLRGNWDVMGLVATASYDFEYPEHFLAADFVEEPTLQPRRGGPLFAIQVSLGHAAWALGVARRTLDELRALARRKQRFGRQTLIDQAIFQRDFAMHEAMLGAAFDHCRNAFSRHYERASRGEDGLEVRAEYRMAACWAVEVSVKIAQFAYLAAGSDGLRNLEGTNRLQRCFRDIHAGSQHRHTDHHILGDCGTVLLGVAKPNLVL
jgi:alkylation response protein AidB-like acyl-CoA dehydrogenase